MIPATFDYFRPHTLDEAVSLLTNHEDAKVLAGGHSLIPAMKLRLAQPKTVIDISRVADLIYLREQDGRIVIGALATHYDIESSALLRDKCPLLSEVAPQIGGSLIARIRIFLQSLDEDASELRWQFRIQLNRGLR